MTTLFTPFEPLKLRNRVVMAPMTRYDCNVRGLPSKALADYYVRRAENDVGLIIVESAAVNGTDAMGYQHGLQFHNDDHVAAWSPIVDRIHAAGAKVWLQLFHAGRLTVPEISGGIPLAPSAVETGGAESFWRPKVDGVVTHFQTGTKFLNPRAVTLSEVAQIVIEFATACELAERAGFDGVELHGAHGYLLHGFCTKLSNERDDEFAASTLEFPRRVVEACRNAISPDFTLGYRLSLHMVDNTYLRYDPEKMDYVALVRMLDENGINVFHCSQLAADKPMFGAKQSLAELVRERTDKPVIVAGNCAKILDKATLLEGPADLLAFGRSLIANPNLATELKSDAEWIPVEFDYAKHAAEII